MRIRRPFSSPGPGGPPGIDPAAMAPDPIDPDVLPGESGAPEQEEDPNTYEILDPDLEIIGIHERADQQRRWFESQQVRNQGIIIPEYAVNVLDHAMDTGKVRGVTVQNLMKTTAPNTHGYYRAQEASLADTLDGFPGFSQEEAQALYTVLAKRGRIELGGTVKPRDKDGNLVRPQSQDLPDAPRMHNKPRVWTKDRPGERVVPDRRVFPDEKPRPNILRQHGRRVNDRLRMGADAALGDVAKWGDRLPWHTNRYMRAAEEGAAEKKHTEQVGVVKRDNARYEAWDRDRTWEEWTVDDDDILIAPRILAEELRNDRETWDERADRWIAGSQNPANPLAPKIFSEDNLIDMDERLYEEASAEADRRFEHESLMGTLAVDPGLRGVFFAEEVTRLGDEYARQYLRRFAKDPTAAIPEDAINAVNFIRIAQREGWCDAPPPAGEAHETLPGV